MKLRITADLPSSSIVLTVNDSEHCVLYRAALPRNSLPRDVSSEDCLRIARQVTQALETALDSMLEGATPRYKIWG
jgi:hypothetical protein